MTTDVGCRARTDVAVELERLVVDRKGVRDQQSRKHSDRGSSPEKESTLPLASGQSDDAPSHPEPLSLECMP